MCRNEFEYVLYDTGAIEFSLSKNPGLLSVESARIDDECCIEHFCCESRPMYREPPRRPNRNIFQTFQLFLKIGKLENPCPEKRNRFLDFGFLGSSCNLNFYKAK